MRPLLKAARSSRMVRRLGVAAGLGGLLLSLTGCGGSDDAKSPGEPRAWGQVCGGIISSETQHYIRLHSDLGKTVYKVRGRDGNATHDAFAVAVKDLAKGPGASGHDSVCRVTDKSGKRLLELSFYWDLDDFSDFATADGDGRVRRLSKAFALSDDGGYGVLSVDCRRPGHVEPGGYPATLHAFLNMPSADTRAEAQVLYAATRKILPGLNCTNHVTVPTALPTRDPRMK
ncbi:hypothetical protein [Streptomyces sp. NRRL F-5126]|uniref:hypothetical protein n=1 Tax=Streptomyces sp. NRRL F-5126 TaxID=1463857 RepID=UPI0004C4B673|nr:hypothetical protein [Streptomyces sp. NRRL F-5126]